MYLKPYYVGVGGSLFNYVPHCHDFCEELNLFLDNNLFSNLISNGPCVVYYFRSELVAHNGSGYLEMTFYFAGRRPEFLKRSFILSATRREHVQSRTSSPVLQIAFKLASRVGTSR